MPLPQRPLTSRPLDLVYFIFFVTHIPVTFLFDGQVVFPAWLVPQFLKDITAMYLLKFRDPLIGGAMGVIQGQEKHQMSWFRSLVVLEVVFQLPVFIIGARALLKDSRTIQPLLLIYGASTATATLGCIGTLLGTPVDNTRHPASASLVAGLHNPNGAQQFLLLALYMPYLLIPLLMTVDMAQRIGKVMGRAVKVVEAVKEE